MANYIASARTNYVHIIDMPGLEAALENFSTVRPTRGSQEEAGMYCFLCEDDDGAGWPGCQYVYDEESGEEKEIEFSWYEHVMPYVQEGEVLVIMEVGAEKLRYLVGYAEALVRIGKRVKGMSIGLHDIYTQAAKKWKIPREQITVAEY